MLSTLSTLVWDFGHGGIAVLVGSHKTLAKLKDLSS